MQYVPAAQIDRLTQKQTASHKYVARYPHKYVARYPRQNLLETVHHNIFYLSIAGGQITSWWEWKVGNRTFHVSAKGCGKVECHMLSKVQHICLSGAFVQQNKLVGKEWKHWPVDCHMLSKGFVQRIRLGYLSSKIRLPTEAETLTCWMSYVLKGICQGFSNWAK